MNICDKSNNNNNNNNNFDHHVNICKTGVPGMNLRLRNSSNGFNESEVGIEPRISDVTSACHDLCFAVIVL